MRYLAAALFGIGVLFLLMNHTEKKVTETFANIQSTTNESLLRLQEEAEKNRLKAEHDAWAKTKTKIYVRAKSAKKCMQLLKIDVLNNEVIECNKDHYVEVRNDELEQFKKDNEL